MAAAAFDVRNYYLARNFHSHLARNFHSHRDSNFVGAADLAADSIAATQGVAVVRKHHQHYDRCKHADKRLASKIDSDNSARRVDTGSGSCERIDFDCFNNTAPRPLRR